MPIRKPTLDEWFLDYQLRKAARGHFFLPIAADVDATPIAAAYEARGVKPPWTAIVVKAAALMTERHPLLNRAIFHTFYGTRIVEFERVVVNLPVMLKENGQSVLGAVPIAEPQRMSMEELQGVIKAGRSRPIAETKVSKYLLQPNTFLNRARLRAIHFVVYNFPALYVRMGGGGVSVSSILNLSADDFHCRVTSYGLTALTIAAVSVSTEADGRKLLRLGIGFDHSAQRGDEALAAVRTLCRVLQDPELRPQFTG